MSELAQILKHTRQHLMNGVSYMLPVVVGGGILMAVAVMLSGQGGCPGNRINGRFMADWLQRAGTYGSCPVRLYRSVHR